MTREEQINKAFQRDDDMGNDYLISFENGRKKGFIEGAKWADSNPNWHKYPDEKPPKNGRYWVVFDTPSEKCTEITTFYDSQFQSLYFEEESGYEDDFLDADCIIAWMELPKPPKFD